MYRDRLFQVSGAIKVQWFNTPFADPLPNGCCIASLARCRKDAIAVLIIDAIKVLSMDVRKEDVVGRDQV